MRKPFSFFLSNDNVGATIGRPYVLIVYVRKFFPFFLAKLPQKEPKTAFLEFRLCGGDQGLRALGWAVAF
ncbi:MAG: hypothetical protein IIX86_08520 [Clostridia bacterium]|nr:hypothetical protein [Clostridia bacterium]